jgi:SAM-dependent methyltransferase
MTSGLTFTAHNIRLDDGTRTMPGTDPFESHPWFLAAARCLRAIYPAGFGGLRIADPGCLEGGYAVEFARMGFGEVIGIEARESNLAKCRAVKAAVDLPALRFVCDDARNLEHYGPFDAVLCSGLLYHFDEPRAFLNMFGRATKRVAIINTHFATEAPQAEKFALSQMTENEGLPGRWYGESDGAWASHGNPRSFWIRREHLIQAIHDSGFPMVFEQFDMQGDDIVGSMDSGFYKTDSRSLFVGVKA